MHSEFIFIPSSLEVSIWAQYTHTQAQCQYSWLNLWKCTRKMQRPKAACSNRFIYIARQLKYLYTVYLSRLSRWHVSTCNFILHGEASIWATMWTEEKKNINRNSLAQITKKSQIYRSCLSRKALLFTYFSYLVFKFSFHTRADCAPSFTFVRLVGRSVGGSADCYV